MLDSVTQKFLTPMGLRTLAPGEPDYQPKYDGDLRPATQPIIREPFGRG